MGVVFTSQGGQFTGTGQIILMSVVFSSQGAIPKRYMLHVPWSNPTYKRSFLESGGQLSKWLTADHLLKSYLWAWFSTLTCFLLYSKALHASLARVYMYQTRNYEWFFLSSQKSMITSSSIRARQSLSLKAIEQSSHHYGFELKIFHVAVVF